MAELLPFVGHVVAGGGAHAVVAPPYDALTPAQRTAMAAADPRSFLNVLPPSGPEVEADLEHTLRACRRNLDRLLGDGHFRPIADPALAVVAIGTGADRATAIVGDLEVGAFTATGEDRVLPHERVRPARVANLVRYLEVVGIASSPVALTHRPHPAVPAATAAATARPPDVAYRDEAGTDLALWLVDDADLQAELRAAVAAAGRLFVADGHHRAAAVAAHRPGTGRVLSAILPGDHLRILPFHRRIHGLGTPVPAEALLQRLRDRGLLLQPLDGASPPAVPGIVHLAIGGTWWAVDLRERRTGAGPVESLDARRAEREVLAPLLAAAEDPGTDTDPANDPRVVAVPAPQGLASLAAPDVVGVALAPPALEDVLAVAEAGEVMPPKTTYVLPKLRSGLLVVSR
ncbi:DUF1015 family protein [Egicoccus sp. AB-alg6-2]|uniref:DUF1015 family protein n=1 Tax=Egicoccus sp. AB-alg6-2 TaxID=3242692 RepID=UPI00359D1B83